MSEDTDPVAIVVLLACRLQLEGLITKELAEHNDQRLYRVAAGPERDAVAREILAELEALTAPGGAA